MSLYKWTRTGYGRTWEIDVEGSGSPDDLLVDKWPKLSFASRPRSKKPGVYPRRLTLPFIDREGERGYLSDRLFNEELTFNLSLDSSLYFKGTSYAENRPKPIEEDEFRTQIIVSDGLDKLDSIRWGFGTYTYTELLREVFSQINNLDIHLFTDWDEDNSIGDLPDVNRITIGSPDDTYLDVLKKFCNTFGYQVYQDEGVWVVRSLAFYSSDSLTRFVITQDTVSSSTVSTFANLSTQYKSSEIDMVRGVGQARTTFEWPLLEGGFGNTDFESFDDGFTSWENQGSPEQIEVNDVFFARLTDSDRLDQRIASIVRQSDRVEFNARCVLNYETSPSGTEDAEWLEIIFRDYRGDDYWLQNDGTVTTTRTFIKEVNATTSNVTFDESVFISTTNGFPSGFSGFVEVRARVDRKFDSTDATFEFSSFDHQFCKVEFVQNTNRFTRQVSDVSLGSLPISKTELDISQNSTQYSGNEVEFYDGSAWKPSLVFGGRTFGVKRSFDEIRVRNTNIDVLRSEGDFGDFLGMSKLYLYEGVRYIAMASDITIGEDDITLYLFRHEVSTGFTENEFFDNGGEASVSSVGGAPSSGTSSGGGGLDQSTADARYFRQTNNLSEGEPSTIRGNVGLSENDTPEFNQLTLSNPATQPTHTVRADRRIIASAGLQTIGNDTLTDDIEIEMTTPLTIGVDTQNITTGGSSEVWDLSTEVWDTSTEEFDPDSHTHALDLSGRSLTLSGDTALNVDNESQNLGANRTWNLSVEDHGASQRGVLKPTAQTIHGEKTLQDNLVLRQDVNSYIGSDSFTKGFDGAGTRYGFFDNSWRQELDDLFIRGSLFANEFIINQILALNGSDILSPGRGKIEEISGSAPNEVIEVSDPQGNNVASFVVGDIVIVQQVTPDAFNGGGQIVKRIVRRVASVNGAEVTLESLSDAPSDGGFIEEGDVIVALGNTTDANRQATIYRSVIDSGSPYVRVNDGVSSYNDWISADKAKLQYGNLEGLPFIEGVLGKIYGFWAEDNLFLTAGQDNPMSFGKDAGGAGLHGIHINSNNRWYGNGQLQVGGVNGLNHFPSQTFDSSTETWDTSESYWNAPIQLGSDVYVDGGAQIAGDAVVDGTLTVSKLDFQENGRIIGSNLSIDADTTFTDDVSIKGTLDGVDGSFSGELQAVTGTLGALTVDDTLTMGSGGQITNSGDDFSIRSNGINIACESISSGAGLRSRSLNFFDDSSFADVLADITYNNITSPLGLRINSTRGISINANDSVRLGFNSGDDIIFTSSQNSGSTSNTESGFISVTINGETRRIKTYVPS